ncbi:HNH endonuclease signature motif containing protein [Protaetiibacter intestinalis]|uniref:HNH endonuclease n=1 Tax=Protaetiibacter intestinalis TaxID=2419774 RepID=A0A387B9C4_9MICO|nr:HNH endonuclease signature motif containing protein [Protaetiibacter intestinalis]AYF98953.1 HNH endonuclease [Protaetiibacter intestinalis]
MRKRPDPVAVADAALGRVVAIQAQMDALSAARAEALLEFEAAFAVAYPPSAAPLRERAERAELACALRMPERAVETLLGESRMLTRQLPATFAALGEGLFSYRHAQVLIDETAELDPVDREAVERVALGVARSVTVAQFRRKVRRLRERRNPESMVERVRTAHTRRELVLEPARDGMAYLGIYTNAVDAAAIYEKATTAAGHAVEDGDPRTLTQLRVDVLVDALLERDSTLGLGRTMLETMNADPDELLAIQETTVGPFAGIIPTVIVTVPIGTLLGGNQPGNLEGVGPIDAATARKLTSHAPVLYRMLTDPDTGTGLSMGRTAYRVPEPLRRWLRVRDGSCRFPMCLICTRRCDIDHTRDWATQNGPTDHDNLAHLSRGHHTLKHHGGWKVVQDTRGVLQWTSYLGREYTTLPDAS